MNNNFEDNYKKVYQCMNDALKYYKKYASQVNINWEEAVNEGWRLHRESSIPEFTSAIITDIQCQLEREEKIK